MTKQKVGLLLFGIAICWAVLWGVILPIFIDSAFRNLTLDELNQTVWALNKPWILIGGLGGVVIGALMAGIGVLLYTNAKGFTIWKFGIGSILTYIISMVVGIAGHIPPLFGMGGSLILLFFMGILWLWAKERIKLSNEHAIAADLRLFGYVFFIIAAWFVCGIASHPFLKALDEVPHSTPVHIMIFMTLGWFFIFLSHYKLRKQ